MHGKLCIPEVSLKLLPEIWKFVDKLANDKVWPFCNTVYISVCQRQVVSGPYGNSQARSNIVRSAYIRQKHTNNKINLKFRVTIIVVATHTKQESAAIYSSTKQRRAMYIMSLDIRALDRWHLTLHRTNGLTRTGLRLSGTLGHRGQNFKFWPMPNPFLHLISLSLSFPPLNRPIKYS